MSVDHPQPTITAALQAAACSGQGVRFLDRRERATYIPYTALYERARRFAGGLRQLGVRRGDRVGLILPTCPGFYDAFFGAMLAGAAPVPVYPPVRLGRLDEYHLRTGRMLGPGGAAVRLVVSDARTRRILGRTAEAVGATLGLVSLDQVPSRADTEAPGGLAPDDLAFIQLSSGTTVDPKPIRLTHRQVLANVHAIIDTILAAHPTPPRGRHSGVSWLPLYHDMGLVGCVMTALEAAEDLTLIPPELFVARPAVWLRTISRYRATISTAPNFAYGLCAERITDQELQGVDLSRWRVALNGAEPVTPAVLGRFARRFQAYGLRPEALTPVYGLAEATLAVTFSDLRRPFGWRAFDRQLLAEHGVARPAAATRASAGPQEGGRGSGLPLVSLGRPLPGVKLRIVDREGADLPEDRLGRLLVLGPSVMEGYHGRPEATAAACAGGWLDTGDLGFLHRGELYLHGRAKDLVVIRGRNHCPQEVEVCLDGLEGVRTGCVAAVGAVADSGEGEELLVFVEHARGTARPHGELQQAVTARVLQATGLRPALVRVLEPGTLPRTSSGKIRRGETLRRHQAGTLSEPRPVNLVRMVGKVVDSGLALRRAQRAAASRR